MPVYRPWTYDLIADYHTHTRYSHGRGTVAQNAAAARARGLYEVAIADHGHRSWPWVRTTPAGLQAMRREVAAVNRKQRGIRVLAGVEANVISLSGELDVPREVLAQLDVVLIGLHPAIIPPTLKDGWSLIGLNRLGRFSIMAAARARSANTEALVAAVYRNEVDIVAHPGWQLPVDTRELARACAKRQTAMEINAGHGGMTPEYCRIALQEGAYLCIGSDAHDPTRVGDFAAALAVAVAARVPPERLLNDRRGPGLLRRKTTAWSESEGDRRPRG